MGGLATAGPPFRVRPSGPRLVSAPGSPFRVGQSVVLVRPPWVRSGQSTAGGVGVERDGVETPSPGSVGRGRQQHSLLWRMVRAWSQWSGRPLWYRFVGAGRWVVGIALAAEALGILLAIGGNADAAFVLSCAI